MDQRAWAGRVVLAVAAALLLPGPALAAPGEQCLAAIAAAERQAGLPERLLHSIALVESGRRDPATGRVAPWPWTINAEGTGRYFESREAAIAAVTALIGQGVRSIDIGCAQVNLHHHPDAFPSLEAAFDPAANTAYAARFLRELRTATGSWPLAAAHYHSRTPERGHAYALKVRAVWPDSERHGPWPAAPAPRRPQPDYSAYTPAFAERLRRIDADFARLARTVGRPDLVLRPPRLGGPGLPQPKSAGAGR